MFRRGQNLLTLLLTAVYLGQSLFLGALHYHEHDTGSCSSHVHVHAATQHGCHEHSGDACTSAHDQPAPSASFVCDAHRHATTVGDSHADCAICQYLSQGQLGNCVSLELTPGRIAPFVSVLEPTNIEHRPFSLPRPRSPPAFGTLAVG